MKKFLSRVASAAICTAMILSAAFSAYAETINVEPDYPLHGNKCGKLFIRPEIDRDIFVKITQLTEDGDYVYYNNVIPAAGESVGENDYSFLLEGKDDPSFSYDISIGVPKYKNSSNQDIFTYNFTINDTDNIVGEVINGYAYTFNITRNNDFKNPTILYSDGPTKNDDNIVEIFKTISFPISDILPGDVDFNGNVDFYDAVEIAKYLLNNNHFNDDQKLAGDYNQNGSTDLYDAIDIARSLIKK